MPDSPILPWPVFSSVGQPTSLIYLTNTTFLKSGHQDNHTQVQLYRQPLFCSCACSFQVAGARMLPQDCIGVHQSSCLYTSRDSQQGMRAM